MPSEDVGAKTHVGNGGGSTPKQSLTHDGKRAPLAPVIQAEASSDESWIDLFDQIEETSTPRPQCLSHASRP
jgi:hypothetical protein